jgi:antitoxin YefM
MYATYRLRADEITDNFLKAIKDAYQDKEIEITVQEVEDETAYLMKSEANRKHLLEAVEEVHIWIMLLR